MKNTICFICNKKVFFEDSPEYNICTECDEHICENCTVYEPDGVNPYCASCLKDKMEIAERIETERIESERIESERIESERIESERNSLKSVRLSVSRTNEYGETTTIGVVFAQIPENISGSQENWIKEGDILHIMEIYD